MDNLTDILISGSIRIINYLYLSGYLQISVSVPIIGSSVCNIRHNHSVLCLVCHWSTALDALPTFLRIELVIIIVMQQ